MVLFTMKIVNLKLLVNNLEFNIYISLSISLLNSKFKLKKEYKESYKLTIEQKESLYKTFILINSSNFANKYLYTFNYSSNLNP